MRNGARVVLAAVLGLALLFVMPGTVRAQTTATYGESQVGVTNCAPNNNSADFDTLAQCNASSGTGTFQKAPIFAGKVTSPPYASTTCDSNKAGMIQWTGTSFQGCDGSSWTAFSGSGGNGPDAFSFTDQTGVNLSTATDSNAVSLTGFTGALAASCNSGCTAIARNGTWGTTTGVFLPSDTIAIRQTSSASVSTATTATVTVGTRTSGTWTVTTGDNSPNAFSFTDQTGVDFSTTISSNAVTLAGFAGPQTATCGTGCTAIARNSSWGSTTVTGFMPGDTIAIRQTSASVSLTTTTATVNVGGTTSGTWSVTTMNDPCTGSPSVGTVCNDGSVYAGLTPDGSVKMFATRCDGARTWSGSACTGSRTYVQWASGYSVTGYTSTTAGETNSDGLAALGSSFAAAYYCANLTMHSKSDWYLPAKDELSVLQTNKTAIGDFYSGDYHSSTERDSSTSWYQTMSSSSPDWAGKTYNDYVRCVRK